MDSSIDLATLMRRYVGRHVSITTYGQSKIVGQVATVHIDCVRLVDTQVIGELEDQSWFSKMQHSDPDNNYGPRDLETIIQLHSIHSVTCLENDIDLPTPAEFYDSETKESLRNQAERREKEEANKKDELIYEVVDPLSLELGVGLIPLADPARSGDLLQRITKCRGEILQQTGFQMPKVRVRDNIGLSQNEYRIRVAGCEVARGDILTEHILAIDSGETTDTIDGIETLDPAFGAKAIWIDPKSRDAAEIAGYHVVEPSAVLVTHLSEIVKRRAGELLSCEQVSHLIKEIDASWLCPDSNVMPGMPSVSTPHILLVHAVLQRLLAERVSINNLLVILECLGRHASTIQDVEHLLAEVRECIGRSICQGHRDKTGRLHGIAIGAELEQRFAELLRRPYDDNTQAYILAFVIHIQNLWQTIQTPVCPIFVVVDEQLRPVLWKAIAAQLPQMSVLARAEIPGDLKLDIVATVGTEEIEEVLEAELQGGDQTAEENFRKLPR